jgi:hypothetical protein
MISIKRNIRLVSRKLSILSGAVTLISLSLKRLAVPLPQQKLQVTLQCFSDAIVASFFQSINIINVFSRWSMSSLASNIF